MLGGAAGAVALDQKNLGAAGTPTAAIRELAGQPQLAGRALALEFFLLALALAVFRALDDEIEELPRAVGIRGKPVVEMVLERAVYQPKRLGRGEALLGLALELWLADEER